MYREILTNKWFLIACGFLVIFAGACYLYYQHTTAPYRQQAAELDEIIRKSEKQRTAETANPKGQAADAPAQTNTPTAEKSITQTHTVETNETTDPVTTATQVTDDTEEVRMSPHGFGPYPKIPDGYPSSDPFFDDMGRSFELLQRVRIKLFEEQGIFAEGLSISQYTGKVKYVTRDIIWIEWGRANLPGLGEQRYAVSIRGHPDTVARIRANVGNRESPLPVEARQITEVDIPPDIVVKSGSEEIDPYQFLNLQRQ